MPRLPRRQHYSPRWRRRLASIVRNAARAGWAEALTHSRPSPAAPLNNRDRIRDQRLELCVPLRMQGKSWRAIYQTYRETIERSPGAVPDPKASGDALRQMCERYRPELKK